jgi:hypothetical protein
MKTRIVTLAGLLAAMLSLPTQAEKLPDRPAHLILAQAGGGATCEQDGRRVPRGTTYCREGYVMRCSGRGSWQKTDKRC